MLSRFNGRDVAHSVPERGNLPGDFAKGSE